MLVDPRTFNGTVGVAKAANWNSFSSVRNDFPDPDLVHELLVFSIRQNRYRLLTYPVFARHKLYIKALLNHREYDRKDWREKWP